MLTEADLNPKYHLMWRDVISYFNETGREAIELITASCEKGMKRSPRRQDIFVHPQFPFSHNARTFVAGGNESLNTYKSSISQAIALAQHPLFVTYLEGAQDWPELVMPDERVISSIPYPFQTTGAIAIPSLEHFLSLLGGIHPDDEFRIHGAALGCCLTEFARQLYGIVYAGQFWPDIPDHKKDERFEEYCADLALTQLLVDNSLGSSPILGKPLH